MKSQDIVNVEIGVGLKSLDPGNGARNPGGPIPDVALYNARRDELGSNTGSGEAKPGERHQVGIATKGLPDNLKIRGADCFDSNYTARLRTGGGCIPYYSGDSWTQNPDGTVLYQDMGAHTLKDED